ncbi:MAG: zinc ribbon domain-containing protein [Nitrospirae bacterium]|nr:zinc ribbon domain-containing protein [Nitrospirota bacterium]
MPVYEYSCKICGKTYEFIRRFKDKPLNTCPECGGPMKKLISNTSFVLKGTGWYKTDYTDYKVNAPAKGSETSDKKESVTPASSKK